MEPNVHNQSSEGTIDFDDQYSEDEDYLNFIVKPPLEVPQSNLNLLHETDEIQINPEDKEQILDEENIIYDPKVKELNEIDINNKQAIIDILMDDELIQAKPIKTPEYLKEKNKAKFSYVKSNINNLIIEGKNSPEKKNTYGRTGFQIESQEGDPEYIKDINIAADKLKDQIREENRDIAKLLFDDMNNKKIKKIITRKDIGEKVKKALDKKKENLEKIEKKLNKKQESLETFAPKINHRKKDGNRRDLSSFLKSQKDFQKKVEQKRQEILLQNESELKELKRDKPQLTKNTEELIKKKYGTERTEPIYLRLYNQMIKNEDKIKQAEEKIILREKEEEKKRKEVENELKKNNPYKHIKARVNLSQTNFREIKDNKGLKRVRSAENIKSNNIVINNDENNNNINKKSNLEYKFIQLNKVLYNKFISDFDDALKLISEENKNKSKENKLLEELDEYQYFKLLFELNIVPNPKEKNEITEKQIELNGLNVLNPREKKLVKNSFKLMNLSGDKISVIDVKNFLICVIGLQNFNLYQMYKTQHEHDLKDEFPLYKYKKEEIPELILEKQNKELISQINKKNKKNNKYFSLSKDNKIIFTLEKSNIINRDFNKFAVNYRSQKKKNKELELKNLIKKECPFKPEIGEKSNELYQKHKDKVYSNQNDNLNFKIRKSKLEYVNRILLLDKKRIFENQKIKEEMEQKKIKECTFKPKISNYFTHNDNNNNKKKIGTSDKNVIKINKTKINKGKNKNVFDELYEDGKQKLKLKKDKSQDEIDLEKQKKDLTFQPNIEDLDLKKIPKTNFINDIYNEKEYKIRYERLKRGRLQRLVNINKNNRLGLNDELKKFVKDNKEYNYIQNNQYFETDDPFYYNTLEINTMKNKLDKNEKEVTERINKSQEIISQKNDLNEKNTIESNNNENINKNEKLTSEPKNSDKSEIPLLIIDVNIGQGIKKKIYVYEGDTAEELAQNFAKENNLEEEVKNKLKSLIESHMERLLTRIEEENGPNQRKYKNVYRIKSGK